MPTVTNNTHEELEIPSLGLLLAPGESATIADEDAEGFVGHGLLTLTGYTPPEPPPAPPEQPAGETVSATGQE